MNENMCNNAAQGCLPCVQQISAANRRREYTKADTALSVFIMIASFCIIRYVMFKVMGFITTGVFIALITAALIYMKKRNCTFTKFNKLHAGVLYVFSLVFSITANDYIKELDIAFILGAGAYLIYSVAAGNKDIDRYLPFAVCKALFEYPFSYFGEQMHVTKAQLDKTKAGSNVKYVLIGLLLTLPLTGIVAALLMSADDGLARMFSDIFDVIFSEEIVKVFLQILLAIPLSMYLFGMLFSNTHRNLIDPLDEQKCVQSIFSKRCISNLVMYTAITPICVLYVMFFISQGSYFLSAFTNSLPEGFTYADYARQGFFELCAVAVINLIVLIIISLFSKKAGAEKPFALKLYSVVLGVFTIILIATAMSKMVMYIMHFGLTELRLYTSWFMLLLAFIFVLIIIKQFRFNIKFARHVLIGFTFMFAVLCFSRPEAIIAKYNIEMYNSGYLDELDIDSIIRMSADGLLVAYNEEVLTDDKIKEIIDLRLEIDSFKRFNITSVILESKVS